MKLRSSFTAVLIALCAMPLALRAQDQTPIIPMGSLSAYPTIVQAGTHPTLTWDVTLPERVVDVVTMQAPSTLVPKRNLVVDIRVLGTPLKRVLTNGSGKVMGWEWVKTQVQINHNSNGFKQIYYNIHENVNPNYIAAWDNLSPGDTLTFGGRYVQENGSWSPWYSSANSPYHVVALKDGDLPPTVTPFHQQASLHPFLLPYLDENGHINLGARDIIVLMELTHTDRNHSGFDLQDLALLVTFYDEATAPEFVESGTTSGNGNNGHGNNVDGVDSSNPGNAPFTDSDPNTDDEILRRGRRIK